MMLLKVPASNALSIQKVFHLKKYEYFLHSFAMRSFTRLLRASQLGQKCQNVGRVAFSHESTARTLIKREDGIVEIPW